MGHEATELDRPVPLYMQVVRQIRARIASGELAEGDRIPSQREMMQMWRISMQTASKVIGALKTEGLAIPSVGRDTIVAPGAATRIAAAAQGTAHAAAEPLEAPNTRIIEVTAAKTGAPANVAEILGIPSGRRALRRQETQAGEDGKVISFVTTWYSPAILDQAPSLAKSHPLPAGTLAYIAEAATVRPARATEEVAAAPADDDAAAALGIISSAAVLIIRTRYYAADGKLIEYAETIRPTASPYTRTYALTSDLAVDRAPSSPLNEVNPPSLFSCRTPHEERGLG